MTSSYSTWDDVATLVRGIVNQARLLKDKHTNETAAPVSYACIFAQDDHEYSTLAQIVGSVGDLANDTKSGPVYVVPGLETDAGTLRVVKVRKPDAAHPDRGDADFAARNYAELKRDYLDRPGFKLMPRDEFEMIELVDSTFEVRVYFSNPPVEQHSGIREALQRNHP